MSKETELNIFELMKDWFDFCFENPELVNSNHSAMYFFILSHSNRLGWKSKFGLPMQMTMDAIGIKNYRTFSNTFRDLTDWGFILLLQKSVNQYSANVIGLVKNTKATTKALSKATQKHSQKQVHGIVGIIKPITNIPITKEGEEEKFPPQIQRRFLLEIEEVEEYLLSEIEWKTTRIATPLNLNIEKVDFLIKEFSETLKGRGEEQKTPADAKSHFYNWIKTNAKNKPSETDIGAEIESNVTRLIEADRNRQN